jgi:hypothetical protein
MGALIFACPKTRHPIDAGIETDQEILSGSQSIKISVRCPHCWARHALTIGEGFLATPPRATV